MRNGGRSKDRPVRGPIRRALNVLSWLLAAVIVGVVLKKGVDVYASYRQKEAAREQIIREADRTIEGLRGRVGELEEALAVRRVTRVTGTQVREKLDEIGELSVSAFSYSGSRTITNARQILGADIPGTANRISLRYNGVIKVGYDLEDIKYSVNDIDMTIIVQLPRPHVLDNYIVFDTLECEESNSILNPLSFEHLAEYFSGIEDEELKKAEEQDVYGRADARIRRIVTAYLSAFTDYSLEFRDPPPAQ